MGAPAGPRGAFLGVGESLTGRRWVERAFDAQLAGVHARALGAPDLLARMLAQRGVPPGEGARHLKPRLKDELPDPFVLRDMDKAVQAVADAIDAGVGACVFADYDVDGATAAAQLIRYFRALGRKLDLYVPDRMKEGYGPSPEAFRVIQARGVEIVITVDCGATARAALEEAARIGLSVVVIDHHLMGADAPPAVALVNPNRPDCNSGLGYLTGAGVAFVLMVALNREGRARGWFADRPEPDLMSMLDLAALGTLCDVGPLIGLNRAIAAQGLRVLERLEKPGLAALATAARSRAPKTVYDATFVLGPRLNAGGRIGDSTLATRLLISDDPAECADLALALEALNTERRAIEQAAADQAERQIETGQAGALGDPAIVVAGDWAPGVVGIVAGRLKEKHLKPAIVIGWAGVEEGWAKGSGRSVPGVNLGDAVGRAARDGLLAAGGGHAMAAGLTIARDRIDRFRDFLCAAVAEEMSRAHEARELAIDGIVGLAGATPELVEAIDQAGPFGPGAPEPVFVAPDVRIAFAARAGEDHVRLQIEDVDGRRIKAVAFRAAKTAMGEALLQRSGRRFHVAGRLKVDDWSGGRSAELHLVDAAFADSATS